MHVLFLCTSYWFRLIILVQRVRIYHWENVSLLENKLVWCCWIFVDFLNVRRELVIFNTDKRSLFLNNIWSIVQVCLAIEYFSKRHFGHTTTEMFTVRRTARYLCKFLLECQRDKQELHHVEGCLISGTVVIKFAL